MATPVISARWGVDGGGNPQTQALATTQGAGVSILFTGTDTTTNPAGWTVVFYLDQAGTPSGTSPAYYTVSTPSITFGGTGPYTITVPMPRSETADWPVGNYVWQLWRTDSGDWPLASGTLAVAATTRPNA